MSTLPCPSCGSSVPPGAPFCKMCGHDLRRDAMPGGTEPTCAVHPTRLGRIICERCGSFACAQCTRSDMQGQMLCLACHEREPAAPLPWDEREELGVPKAFWRTCVTVLLHPDSFSLARAEGSTGGSLLFALLCSLPSALSTGLLYMLLFTLAPMLFNSKTNPSTEPQWLGVASFVFCIVLVPLFSLLSTVVVAGLDHLVLRMGGATRGFGVTLRANALSQAPWILGLVPLVGGQVGLIWSLVARVFAYRGLHRTGWGLAVAGTLIAPALTCLVCGGGYVALMAAAMSNIVAH